MMTKVTIENSQAPEYGHGKAVEVEVMGIDFNGNMLERTYRDIKELKPGDKVEFWIHSSQGLKVTEIDATP